MKVKVVKKFKDLETGKIRAIGDEFTVRGKRGNHLIELGFVEELTEVAE